MFDKNDKLDAEQIARELDFLALVDEVKAKLPEEYREGFARFWTEKYEQKLAKEIKKMKDFEKIVNAAVLVFFVTVVGLAVAYRISKDL